MVRKLARHTITVLTPFAVTAGLLLGFGLWRQSQDRDWCRNAVAAGEVEGHSPGTPNIAEDLRAACAAHRERQRAMFGAIWRTGGQEAAQCGFELARLQLTSPHDPGWRDGVLRQYGIDSAFEPSERPDQDRFVKACMARQGRGAR